MQKCFEADAVSKMEKKKKRLYSVLFAMEVCLREKLKFYFWITIKLVVIITSNNQKHKVVMDSKVKEMAFIYTGNWECQKCLWYPAGEVLFVCFLKKTLLNKCTSLYINRSLPFEKKLSAGKCLYHHKISASS